MSIALLINVISFRPDSDPQIVWTWILYTIKCGWWCKKGLPTSHQWRWRVVWAHCVCVEWAWPACDWHGSLAVVNLSSCLHQTKRRLLWTQPALMNSDKYAYVVLMCIWDFPYVCCKLPLFQLSVWRRDFTKYGVPTLHMWWEIFPTLNVANCEAPAVKV